MNRYLNMNEKKYSPAILAGYCRSNGSAKQMAVSNRPKMGRLYVLAAMALLCSATAVHAVGLTYIDAVDQSYGAGPPPTNLFQSNGSPLDNTDPYDQLNPLTNANTPNVWGWRSFGVPSGGFSTIYESSEENAPEIRMTTTGLAAGNYDVYVVYWSDRASNWNIRAGMAPHATTPLTIFDRTGGNAGALAGTLASSAAWTVRPANNSDPTTDDNPSPFVDHTPSAEVQFTRDMFLGRVGQNVAAVGGQISVWLDDLAAAGAPATIGAGNRSWIEGLAFVPSGNQVFVTATLDRNTGNLTIANPTSENFTIASYSINSAVGGLDATEWLDQTHDRNALNDPNPWALTSPASCTVWPGCAPESNLALSEAETPAVNGLVFPATSGVINFGNIWRRTPFEDVQVNLTMTNGDVVVVSPTYTGTAITAGDFNADGSINTTDYIALIGGLHADFATRALAYSGGDINGNGVVDRNDVTLFRNVFDTANGAGSFVAMLASLAVPEPSTALLCGLGLGGWAVVARRRRDRNENWISIDGSLANVAAQLGASRVMVPIAALLVCGVLVSTAAAAPVGSGAKPWTLDTLVTANVPNPPVILTNPGTPSPTVGNGTTNSARNVNIWAEMPAPIDIFNGEEIVLSGQVTLTGIGAGTGNGAFRWGLFRDYFEQFKVDAAMPDAVRNGPSAAWQGYLASNASGGGNGRLDAKNPDATDFLTATHISTNSTALAAGNCTDAAVNCGARVFNLAMGGSTDAFVAGTYTFQINVGRYGNEVTASATMTSTATVNPGDFNNNGVVDAADYVAWRDRLGQTFQLPNEGANVTPGMVTQDDYDTWRANIGRTSRPAYTYNLGGGVDAEGIPPTGTGATRTLNHVPFTYDRVALFFADHLEADQAQVTGVDVSKQVIQALTLEVNLANNGATRIINNSTESFDMIYYEITSGAGSLRPQNWTSFADSETGGNLAPGVEWDEAGGSDASVLSEINLTGTPKVFNTGGSFANLGNVFNPASTQDLRFFFLRQDGALVRGVVNYVGGASSVALVPEPGSALLLVCGALVACGWGRSRRRGSAGY